jgi:site-specific recombinase XerD
MTDVQVPASAVEPTPLEEVAGQFLAYLHASGCSPNTVRAYGHDLTHLAAFLVEQDLDWRTLTPAAGSVPR